MEPLSIATALASYLLSKEVFATVGEGVLSQRADAAICGVANQSARRVQTVYRRLKEQEARGQVPANHDVERGIYQAYLQASLAVVVAELGVMNVEPPRVRWQGFHRRRTLRVDAYPYATWLERTYRHLQEEYDRMQADDNELPPPLAVRPDPTSDENGPTTLSEAPGVAAVVAADLNVLLAPPTQVDADDTLQARVETIRTALTDLVEHALTAEGGPPPNFAAQFSTRLQTEWYALFAAFFSEAGKTMPRLHHALEQHYFAEIREALRRSEARGGDLRTLLARLPTAKTLTDTFEARLREDGAAIRARMDTFEERLRAQGRRGEQMLATLTSSVESLAPLLQTLAIGQNDQQNALDSIRAVLDQQRYQPDEARGRVTQRFTRLTREFAGRAEEIRSLDAFLTERTHGVLLVYGPAGAGKSTLVANWLAAYEQRNRDVAVRPRFAYHAFSQEAGTTDRTDAYVNLLHQVYETAPLDDGSDARPTHGTYANERKALEDLRTEICSCGASPETPLVLVLDALDEAAPVDAGQRLEMPIPFNLPPHVYLVASVRDVAPAPLPYHLGEWGERADCSVFVAPSLPPDDIAAWLRQSAWAAVRALADRAEVVQQLYEVSESGYPLFLRFLLADLEDATLGNAPLDAVYDQTPGGFADYVERALDRMREDMEDDLLENLFALLTVTLGPIQVTDVQALEATRRFYSAKLTPQLRRWISVVQGMDGGKALSFTHPKLAMVFREDEEFRAVTKDAEDALISHCLNWKQNGSRYALRHVSDHLARTLEETEAPQTREALYALARDETYRSTVARELPTDFDLPLRPLMHALDDAIHVESTPDIAEFMLAHATAAEALRKRPPRWVWLETRNLDAALAAAAHLMPSSLGAFELLTLAWTLHREGRNDAVHEVLGALASNVVPRLESSYFPFASWLLLTLLESKHARALAWHWLKPSDYVELLAQAGHFDEARMTAEQFENDADRAKAFSAVAHARRFDEAFRIANRPNAKGSLHLIAQLIAEGGGSNEARTAAERIEDDYYRAEVLSALARAEHDNLAQMISDEARTAAERIEDDYCRASALTALTKALAQAGHLGQARTTAGHIEDNYYRAEALGMLSLALTQAGQDASAQTAFDDACAIIVRIENDIYGPPVLNRLARAFAQAGHDARVHAVFDEARKAAERIDIGPRARLRVAALSTLAQVLAQTGHEIHAQTIFDAARMATERIEGAHYRDGALFSLATALAISGLFDEARATANQIVARNTQVAALGALATALAQARYFDEARKEIERISDDFFRAKALGTLAVALAIAERFDEAHYETERIGSDFIRAQSLSTLARVLAQSGNDDYAQTVFDEARKFAVGIQNDDYRAQALYSLARDFTRAGCFDDARMTARCIECDSYRAKALSMLAGTLAQAGYNARAQSTFDEARKTIEGIESDYSRTFSLSTLTQARAQAGHDDQSQITFDQTREVAERIKDQRARVQALATLTQFLAKTGRADDAMRTTSAITHNHEAHLREIALACTGAATHTSLFTLSPLFARYPSTALAALSGLIRFFPDHAEAIMERAAPYLPPSSRVVTPDSPSPALSSAPSS